ncbi:MAG TPA: hypothetical protein VFS20_30590 [Longimicrobium sp.]|nr:hypothetical protein [Longimicrobium sp.]
MPEGVRCLRDEGAGTLARTWDHLVTVAPDPSGGSRYTDHVRVAAGVLTPMVWLFAQALFRWRQRRLREAAATGFARLAIAPDHAAGRADGVE